ncbi:MAG: selenide, water dikinase SelD [Cyclobacteriaceae bacterium]
MSEIKLTSYSHGAGCGCKISPAILDRMLAGFSKSESFPGLLVGNDTRDDAAVFDTGDGRAVISTTDFFMPIVDDPVDFGRIASVNAISDVYAMGGKPIMAIAILGWPIDKIAPEVAGEVLRGARQACSEAGIPLAGGHSIDAPEPIFGLSVTGMVDTENLKRNDGARSGAALFLTKPLGVGIISTAQKKGLAQPDDLERARNSMVTLNSIGSKLGTKPYVQALTDVTGFGLLGHLSEVCRAAGVSATLYADKVPLLPNLDYYLEQKAIPGGTTRNWQSYGKDIADLTDSQKILFCDPQTSGGLLIAVDPDHIGTFREFMKGEGFNLQQIGELTEQQEKLVYVK